MTINDNSSNNGVPLNAKKPSSTKRGNSGTNAKGSKKPRSIGLNPIPTTTSPGNVSIIDSITPNKSPHDPNEYRVLKLSTGLTVALISRKNPIDNGDGPMSTCSYSTFRSTWPLLKDSAPKCHFIDPSTFPLGCTSTTNGTDDWGDIPSTIHHRACSAQQDCTSVAVVVNVGALNDPVKWQGLAHFTEHMVHYGTKKFPSEDAVNLVVANFGTYNATTKLHTTNYYNEVPDILLEKNLELFSEMLAQPLFHLDVLNREVMAIDNEFYIRLPSWRKFLLMPHVCIKNNDHPLKMNMCGSLQTLGKGTEGKQVQSAMKELHQKNYVASAMTLSINSTISLDELEVLTLRYFSNLLQGDRPILAETMREKIKPVVIQGGQHVYLKGLSSKRMELTLLWFMSPPSSTSNIQEEYQSRVMPLIQRILSDTSVTSLDYYLRSQELIYYMIPQQNITLTHYLTNVEINFLLTEKGSQNTTQIIQATLDYLNFLRDGSHKAEMDRLFQEMRIHNLKQYHYGNQMTSLGTTKDFAMRLQYLDNVEDILSNESWSDSKFNFENVKEILTHLNEDNLIVIETLKKGTKLEEMGVVQIAPHSGAEYVVKPRNINGRRSSSQGRPQFGFVPENPFLTLDVKTMACNKNNGKGGGDASSYRLRCPENWGDIKSQPLNWRSRNDSTRGDAIPKIFGVHRGHSGISHNPLYSIIGIHFSSPMFLTSTPMTFSLSSLWTHAILQNINHMQSELCSAGFHISVHFNGVISIVIRGFPRQMDQIAKNLVSHIFEKDITPVVFSLAKQALAVNWEGYLSQPDVVTEYIQNCSILQQANMDVDFIGSLEELTLDDLNGFIDRFKQSAYAIVELYGNLPLQTFESIASHLEKMPFAPIMDNTPLIYSNQNYLSIHHDFYSPGETCIRVKNTASDSYTTSVSNLYALGPYGTDQRQADLFSAAMSFMKTEAFLELRTKQQLGYVVYSRNLIFPNVKVPVMMFSITVVATAKKFTPCELDQKIDQFLAGYAERLENINPELFQTMLRLTRTPSTITQDDVAAWFREKFNPNFGKRDIKWKCAVAGIKKQSIQVLSENEDSVKKACKSCQICDSIGDNDNDWVPGSNTGSQFLYAQGKGYTKNYFVSSFR